jgi:hypothetical protein
VAGEKAIGDEDAQRLDLERQFGIDKASREQRQREEQRTKERHARGLCERCAGDKAIECFLCQGSGIWLPDVEYAKRDICRDCRGTGQWAKRTCMMCSGSGKWSSWQDKRHRAKVLAKESN